MRRTWWRGKCFLCIKSGNLGHFSGKNVRTTWWTKGVKFRQVHLPKSACIIKSNNVDAFASGRLAFLLHKLCCASTHVMCLAQQPENLAQLITLDLNVRNLTKRGWTGFSELTKGKEWLEDAVDQV